MKLIFLGPPGVGKGTHGELVSQKLGVPKISTGDIFRQEIKTCSDSGKSLKEILDSGNLVPDEMTVDILKKRISQNDCGKGFILDGFPRTIVQAEALEKFTKIDKVINFNLSRESILERLAGRWTCKNCQAIYHEKHLKPKREGICDKCGGQLYQREDQTTEAIVKRLEIYDRETKPLIDFYRQRGLLVDIDCEGSVEDVSKRVFLSLNLQKVNMERTLVVIKPDGVERNLAGEIVKRYQSVGLKVIALKMLKVKTSLIKKHYPEEEGYLISLGKKSESAGTPISDYKAQGLRIVKWLRKYLTSGPVVAMILEGENAIQLVRKVTGYTDPSTADKGTIRGDLGQDSILVANGEKRPVRNLIHASGNPEEAEKEIALWFKQKEIIS